MENIFSKLESVKKSSNALQKEEREGGLAEVDMSALWSHLSMHHALLNQQEVIWRHKSRVQSLREGDRNIHFFYQVTVVCRHRNRIIAL